LDFILEIQRVNIFVDCRTCYATHYNNPTMVYKIPKGATRIHISNPTKR